MFRSLSLPVVAIVLCAASARPGAYDAVALNKELIGNEVKAAGFMGKEIEVTGTFYGTKIVKNKEGETVGYKVTFQGYAGLGECLHVLCTYTDEAAIRDLKAGQKITIKGKVAEVVRDVIIIEAR